MTTTDSSIPNREHLPNHVAIIMDGNGRWAQERGKPRVFGHRYGVEAVRGVVKTADEVGIKVLSLFAFSEENWGRPSHEVSTIFRLLNTFLVNELDELHRANVRVRAIGQGDRLPGKSRQLIRDAEETTSCNTGLLLNVALSYGGRSEIVEACQRLAKRCVDGELAAEDINRDAFVAELSTAGFPDPDLLIRTSGEQRISNFMLWQLAYTEMYFPKVAWPDFGREHFIEALTEYARRQRRFGLVPKSSSSRKQADASRVSPSGNLSC